jgi:hypothetical protein
VPRGSERAALAQRNGCLQSKPAESAYVSRNYFGLELLLRAATRKRDQRVMKRCSAVRVPIIALLAALLNSSTWLQSLPNATFLTSKEPLDASAKVTRPI